MQSGSLSLIDVDHWHEFTQNDKGMVWHPYIRDIGLWLNARETGNNRTKHRFNTSKLSETE